MVCEVVQLFAHRETIEDFVNREGVASTTAIEYRFALTNSEARKRLKALAAAGKIKCAGRRGYDWGAVCDWHALDYAG